MGYEPLPGGRLMLLEAVAYRMMHTFYYTIHTLPRWLVYWEYMELPYRRFIISCGFLSVIGLLLFVVGAITNERMTHAYLFWNLLLSWIPLGIALVLDRQMTTKTKKLSVRLVLLAVAWLIFLPNTFYMLTDYIHVTEVARVDPVADSVLFSLIVSIGFALGIVSLLIIHKALLRITTTSRAQIIIGGVIASSSFAIYLGREQRFNSWDIITSPLHLLRDIVHIIFLPQDNIAAYITTLTFFIVITAVYAATWYISDVPAVKN